MCVCEGVGGGVCAREKNRFPSERQATAFIEATLGQRLPGPFAEALKDGVILCDFCAWWWEKGRRGRREGSEIGESVSVI